jgi:hypothetical protein
MRVAHRAQRHGINEVHMARDERGEGRLGIIPGEFPQKVQVVSLHFIDIFTRRRKGNRLFFGRMMFPANVSALKNANAYERISQDSENNYCVEIKME